jgi:hypothetical protein
MFGKNKQSTGNETLAGFSGNQFYYDFAYSLIKKANLLTGETATDQDYARSLAAEIEKSMALMIMNELKMDSLDAYVKLTQEKSSPEDFFKFLKDNIEDFEGKRDKFFEDFAYRFIARTAKLRQSLE